MATTFFGPAPVACTPALASNTSESQNIAITSRNAVARVQHCEADTFRCRRSSNGRAGSSTTRETATQEQKRRHSVSRRHRNEEAFSPVEGTVGETLCASHDSEAERTRDPAVLCVVRHSSVICNCFSSFCFGCKSKPSPGFLLGSEEKKKDCVSISR